MNTEELRRVAEAWRENAEAVIAAGLSDEPEADAEEFNAVALTLNSAADKIAALEAENAARSKI